MKRPPPPAPLLAPIPPAPNVMPWWWRWTVLALAVVGTLAIVGVLALAWVR